MPKIKGRTHHRQHLIARTVFMHHVSSTVIICVTLRVFSTVPPNAYSYITIKTSYFVDASKNISEHMEDLYNFTKGSPLMNSEFYVGWMTVWGTPYTPVVYNNAIEHTLKQMLSYHRTVHFNMYMFCGGTNFGVSSGKIVFSSQDSKSASSKS